jgi:hypothetical protein
MTFAPCAVKNLKMNLGVLIHFIHIYPVKNVIVKSLLPVKIL